MLARIIFLIGSVLSLYGTWELIGPLLYDGISAEPRQGLLFMAAGVILVVSGYYFEKHDSV